MDLRTIRVHWSGRPGTRLQGLGTGEWHCANIIWTAESASKGEWPVNNV